MRNNERKMAARRHRGSNRVRRSQPKSGIAREKNSLVSPGETSESYWLHMRFFDDAFTGSFVS